MYMCENWLVIMHFIWFTKSMSFGMLAVVGKNEVAQLTICALTDASLGQLG